MTASAEVAAAAPEQWVGAGVHRFRWSEPVVALRGGAQSRVWTHGGIAVTAAGQLLVPDDNRSDILVHDSTGVRVGSWSSGAAQAHGLTVVTEAMEEYVWVADSGKYRERDDATGEYHHVKPNDPVRGAVVKFTASGTRTAVLATPEHPAYVDGDYAPTSVAVDLSACGGSGDVWVSDGYGQSLVHHFDPEGNLLGTLDGSTGAGRFRQPHAVFIDHRGLDPELLVADRLNRRVQVFDLDGRFIRSYGADYLLSPSGFVAWGEDLVVAELDGRLTVVDAQDRLVRTLGAARILDRSRAGWPNALDHGLPARPPVEPAAFNSPHGVAVDADLNLYVTEFVIGGRVVKLEHVGAAG